MRTLVFALCFLVVHTTLAQAAPSDVYAAAEASGGRPAPGGTDSGAPSTAPEATSPQAFVDAHNAVRATENVVPLAWNETVANFARDYAAKVGPTCRFEHSGGPYGECLFMGGGDATAKQIVDYWASEKKWYDPQTKKCNPPKDESCGHYLQVVNPNARQLGCGRVKCGNDPFYWIVTCNYPW